VDSPWTGASVSRGKHPETAAIAFGIIVIASLREFDSAMKTRGGVEAEAAEQRSQIANVLATSHTIMAEAMQPGPR
jgi:hypothetical protein